MVSFMFEEQEVFVEAEEFVDQHMCSSDVVYKSLLRGLVEKPLVLLFLK